MKLKRVEKHLLTVSLRKNSYCTIHPDDSPNSAGFHNIGRVEKLSLLLVLRQDVIERSRRGGGRCVYRDPSPLQRLKKKKNYLPKSTGRTFFLESLVFIPNDCLHLPQVFERITSESTQIPTEPLCHEQSVRSVTSVQRWWPIGAPGNGNFCQGLFTAPAPEFPATTLRKLYDPVAV